MKKDFKLFYQPQYSLNGSELKISGAEALLRLKSETLCTTAEFINYAEKEGKINELGSFVIENGLKTLSDWKEEGTTKDLSLSLNISAHQIQSTDFLTFLKECLNNYHFDRDKLTFEVKEGIVEDKTVFIENIKKVQELGIKISLDGFGAEATSFNTLLMVDIAEIKIDRLYISSEKYSFRKEKFAKDMVSSFINIANSKNISVVAEGIEKEEELLELKEMGIKKFQGYFFSKAVSNEDFKEIVRDTEVRAI